MAVNYSAWYYNDRYICPTHGMNVQHNE
jgi:hypothetical protein